MKKEKITLDAIKSDLLTVAKDQIFNKTEWRISYVFPTILLAVCFGVFLKILSLGLLFFSVAAYHIVRYVIELMQYQSNKKAIISFTSRGEISITNEVFSHIANETVYEPHGVWRTGGHIRIKFCKSITLYHFNSGSSWRAPRLDEHYSWSKEFHISRKGLGNISILGDEFLFIRLQKNCDISYVYPCKNFELDGSLEQ